MRAILLASTIAPHNPQLTVITSSPQVIDILQHWQSDPNWMPDWYVPFRERKIPSLYRLRYHIATGSLAVNPVLVNSRYPLLRNVAKPLCRLLLHNLGKRCDKDELTQRISQMVRNHAATTH